MPQMLVNARKFIDAIPAYQGLYDEESMRGEFHRMMEDGLLLIAEENGIHLGGVGAAVTPFFINQNLKIAGERFWWVEPNERAQGVGKALFEAIFAAAKEAGCDFLMMLSLADSVSQLYKRLGFTEVEHIYLRRL